MPTNVAVQLDRAYMEDAGMPERRESALRVIHHMLGLSGVSQAHKKELLSIGLWKWTEAEGFAPHAKYHVRLRSLGAIDLENVAKVNHEHVWPRQWIIGQLLGKEEWSLEDLRVFLEQYAVACTVTTEEHARLGQSRASGWQRYVAAGVKVWDMLEDRPFEFPVLDPGRVESDEVTAPEGVEVEGETSKVTPAQAIAARAGGRAEALQGLVDRLEGEDVTVVVGTTRSGEIGDYMRVHDLSVGEPSPAVAYLHWNGKVSVRLLPAEVPSYLLATEGVRTGPHRTYGVNCHLSDDRAVDTAEALIVLALEKARTL